jgi:glycosyltransferase involved in cell wall biosynthesis
LSEAVAKGGNTTLSEVEMTERKGGNLLMVANYPSCTGYAWWLMEHFWKLLAQRAEAVGSLAYLAYPKITKLSKSIQNSPIVPVELSIPWHSIREAAQVTAFLKKKNINYLYLTDQRYFNLQYPVMRACGVNHIIVHDHSPGDRPPVGGLKGAVKVLRNNLPHLSADHVFCVSDFVRRRNIQNAKIPPEKGIVVQNGIPPINSNAAIRKRLLEEMGFDDSTFIVIATGRAHPYKRFDFIIDCAGVLVKKEPDLDVKFLIAGDGPEMARLREKVRIPGLEKTVRLLGFRNDVRDLLCISDIAMHASLGEAFSLSIIEYMSAGLPVLVPDIPSVKQAIRDDINGFVYPKDDSDAVAAYIIDLAKDSRRRIAMGKAAKHDADTRYSIDRCTEDFQMALDDCDFLVRGNQ